MNKIDVEGYRRGTSPLKRDPETNRGTVWYYYRWICISCDKVMTYKDGRKYCVSCDNHHGRMDSKEVKA